MTFVEFAKYIRYFTNTDTSSFTNEDILMLANAEKDEIAVRILGANENYFGLPYTDDLILNQREYPLDVSVAGQFKFVEVKLDGTNWKRIYETDFNLENFVTTEAGIQAAFQGRTPEFALFRNSLWILSDSAIQNVTDGIKIWGYIWPANFTDLTLATEMATAPSTTTHGWPRQFQKLLADKVIIAYKESRDKPLPLTKNDSMWDNRMIQMLDGISHPNQDRTFTSSIPFDNGDSY